MKKDYDPNHLSLTLHPHRDYPQQTKASTCRFSARTPPHPVQIRPISLNADDPIDPVLSSSDPRTYFYAL